ncbi:MAG: hypothetical protein HS116_21185 [Planctomycetes bacterium]|nr:hypothetical protein [Planctomycetota bacterium]
MNKLNLDRDDYNDSNSKTTNNNSLDKPLSRTSRFVLFIDYAFCIILTMCLVIWQPIIAPLCLLAPAFFLALIACYLHKESSCGAFVPYLESVIIKPYSTVHRFLIRPFSIAFEFVFCTVLIGSFMKVRNSLRTSGNWLSNLDSGKDISGWFGGIVIVIAIIGLLVWLASPLGPSKINAFIMSQSFIKQQLKAPGSAEFCSYREASVIELDQGRYRVSAYVNAQNSFGVSLRTHYTCEIKCVGKGKWEVVRLEIFD